ncbi:family 16 glycosylhydrolase [Falsiroseomonas ponticola]|uniref:family 16 glycosylhydrolase n=1 Tax=Falsiroseomonas ponticola TaxID=2786951 RepID=UPI001934AC1B|nr:family 16 glycosylhydrolase [Roseomonas ponticola]
MGTTTDTNPTPLDMTGWNTVFFDGFNGSQLDWQKWPITYSGSTYWNGAFYWDASQLTVGNGELTIGMDKQSNGLWSVGGLSSAPYAGAPDGHGNGFLYGRVEIRAKTSAEVTGAGPCFLLWPTSNDHWPPEVDILETPASGNGMFTNHWQGPGGNNDDWYASYEFPLDHSQWHTYALDWFPDRMTLYVDGKAIYTTTQNIPHEKMSVGLQGHVGTAYDGWYGSPNASGVNSVDISVDWVRVSQYTGTTTPTTPTPAVTNQTLTGTAGDDALAGGAGADTITGGAGHDDLQGAAGNDRMEGGRGDDGLTLGSGADTVVFTKGDGVDWVVDFTPGTDRLELHGFTAAQVTTKAASYWGMAGLDVLLPNGEKLFLQGVTALGANDLVLKDVPVAAPSGLVLAGTAADDTLRGGSLADSLSGGAGNDYLQGGTGDDTLAGGAGNDLLYGGVGNDVLIGGDGDDQLRGQAGNDVMTSGAGADRIYVVRGEGQDRVTDFTPGVDKVVLSGITTAEITAKLAVVSGVSGLLLSVADGTSLFLDGVGAVTPKQLGLSGSFAAGSVVAVALPATTATVAGTAGDDWLKGGSGADYLQGGAGSDDLQGLGGNDVLRGGLGDDGLTGGAGADVFVFAKGDGHDWVVDFTRGTDRLWLEGYGAAEVTQAVETRWGMAGLAVHLGTAGEELFLQGVTTALGAADMVFA